MRLGRAPPGESSKNLRAKNSREHNGANVLTLGSGQNNFNEIKEIVTAWLSTELTEDRHKKRVGKIDNIEKQYKK